MLTIARIEQRLERIRGVRVDLTAVRGLKDVVRRRIARDFVDL